MLYPEDQQYPDWLVAKRADPDWVEGQELPTPEFQPRIWKAIDLFVGRMSPALFQAILPSLTAPGGTHGPQDGDGQENTRKRWPALIVRSLLRAGMPRLAQGHPAILVRDWPREYERVHSIWDKGGDQEGVPLVWVETVKSYFILWQKKYGSRAVEIGRVSNTGESGEGSSLDLDYTRRLDLGAVFTVLYGEEMQGRYGRTIYQPYLRNYNAHDPKSVLKALISVGPDLLDNTREKAVWVGPVSPTSKISTMIEALQQAMWRKQQSLPVHHFGGHRYLASKVTVIHAEWGYLFKLLLQWEVVRQVRDLLESRR